MTTRIFVDSTFLANAPDSKPIPLVEAHLKDTPTDQKLKTFGKAVSEFELTDTHGEAELEVVPFDLKTCIETGQLDYVFERLGKAVMADKRLALFVNNDDCLASHHHHPNLLTFSHTGFRSVRAEGEFCVPWFIDDPLKIYCDGKLTVRSKSEKPVIGFCGRAAVTPSRLGWQLYRNAVRTFRSWVRLDPFAPPHIASEVAFRSRILRRLQKSSLVETDFILRSKFLAGISRTPVVRDDPQHPVRLEFVDNLLNTDYTICIRGAANWSMRLYEALSCGRIPVYIDTNSILPFDFKIDWKDYVVWVDEKDISRIDEIVADHHASLTDDDFRAKQIAGRELWEKRLSRDGFYSHFREHLNFNCSSRVASNGVSTGQAEQCS